MIPASLPELVSRHAHERGSAIALSDNQHAISYSELTASIQDWVDTLEGEVLGIMMDNSPAWISLDLAARQCGMTCVPVPLFFSDEQIRHTLKAAGVDCIVTDQPARIERIILHDSVHVESSHIPGLHVYRLSVATLAGRHTGTVKITFTSGTTGTPKGVCLQASTLDQVAHAMCGASGASAEDCMLSLLPLSTLLENVAVYAGLMAGGRVHLPSLGQTGVSMTGVDVEKLCRTVSTAQPSVLVIVPEILSVLIAAVDAGWQPPASLNFIAVGGATVSPGLLEKAATLRLPVYQGYGLSEAASVVCLNKPGANRPGSVGRALPHVRVMISDEGEVLVKGALFSGYLGEDERNEAVFPTGDLGRLDQDGYLYLEGRRKNVMVSAYGRNISPEWLESELMLEPVVARAVVFGDDRPWNIALLAPVPELDIDAITAAIERTNKRLPDYAGIKRFHICEQPFSVAAGEMTANGRLRRDVIEENYRTQIEQLYMENDYAVL